MNKSQLISIKDLIKGCVCFKVTKDYKSEFDHRFVSWGADTLIYMDVDSRHRS